MKDKVMHFIAKRKNITVKELEDEILKEAIDELTSREIINVIKTLKSDKVDEASEYEPSNEDINIVLDK